jgi:hypothetical protein
MTDDSLERLMALYCAYCLGTGMMELVMRDQSREPCPVCIVTRAGASGTPAMPRSFNPALCPPKSPSRRERSRKTQASRPGPNRGEWNADLTDRADRYGLKSRTRILMMTRIYADLKCGDSTPLFPLRLIIRENLPNPPIRVRSGFLLNAGRNSNADLPDDTDRCGFGLLRLDAAFPLCNQTSAKICPIRPIRVPLRILLNAGKWKRGSSG